MIDLNSVKNVQNKITQQYHEYVKQNIEPKFLADIAGPQFQHELEAGLLKKAEKLESYKFYFKGIDVNTPNDKCKFGLFADNESLNEYNVSKALFKIEFPAELISFIKDNYIQKWFNLLMTQLVSLGIKISDVEQKSTLHFIMSAFDSNCTNTMAISRNKVNRLFSPIIFEI